MEENLVEQVDSMDKNSFTDLDEELVIPSDIGRQQYSWYMRTFSKMNKDSLRGGIFVLVVSALGTGMLTTHHLFDALGIFPSLGVIVIVWLMFLFASDIYTKSIKKSFGAKNLNNLVMNIMGKTWGIIFNIIFVLYQFLAIIALVITISGTVYKNFGQQIMHWFGYDFNSQQELQEKFSTFNFYFCYIIGIVFFFLALQKSVDKFRYFSLFGFAIFLYIIFVVIIQFPFYYQEKPKKTYNYYHTDSVAFFQNFGLAVFSFNCLTNFFSVASAVKNPNIRRLRKVFSRAFTILLFFIMLVGLIGYLSLGREKTPETDLIIYREKFGTSDNFMLIGRTFLIVALLVNGGINMFPLKMLMVDLFNIDLSFWKNFILSFVLCIVPIIISSLFTSVSKYASITGCFAGMLICFVYPGMLALRIGYFKKPHKRFFLYLWTILTLALTLICTYFTFLNFL